MIGLGKDESGHPIRFDVDRLVATRMLLQANSGGGKSWALRRILEQTHGAVQQLVIDPEGEFYTLRERFDYVLAGRGGDCPAEPRSADLLARRLLELGCSAVIDIQELKPRDRVRFVRVFLEALVNAPRALWHPALVVIDEAHTFAPQAGHAESADAVADLMAKGRKRGFCGLLATQRISKLHKDVAAEANNMLIGRARQDVDRKRAAEDLGFTTRDQQIGLRKLAPGEFFVFGPAFERDEVTLVQVGPVSTSHPKAGAGAPPVAAPRAKVKALLGELSDLPAEAEEEARTVEQLRAKVRELEAAVVPASLDLDALERVRQGANDRAARAVIEATAPIIEKGRAIAHAARVAMVELQAVIDEVASLEAAPISVPKVEIGARSLAPIAPPMRVARPAPAPRSPRTLSAAAEGISGPMQRILDALAWLESARIPGPYQKTQVAFLARYSAGGGAFNNPLGKLRTAGLIDYPREGMVELTDAGRDVANAPGQPLSAQDLHERVRQVVDGPMWRILEPLIAAYPNAVPKSSLAERAGYAHGGGAFNNPLGRLRSLGLIDYPSSGEAVALPVLFP